MARDMATGIGKKKTLVFYKGRVSNHDKIKTGWIMHEYKLAATLPNQRKFEKDEVSCIEESQSSHYLPPSLGNYIENNVNEAGAARCLTDKADPNKMLAQVEVLDDHEGLEHQSMELWNSYLVSDLPNNGGSGYLPFDLGYLVAENAIPNNPLITEIPIEQEAPQDQSATNEQGSNIGNPVPADERSNQHNLIVDNDGYTTPSNSVQMEFLSSMAGPSMDEVFEKLELAEENPLVQENSFEQVLDDWILDDGISGYLNAFDNQPSINEEQNVTTLDNLCCADMMDLTST